MASLSFEVVHAFTVDGYRGLVIARQLDPGTFSLGAQATLDGRALQRRLEAPRGGPPESFIFYLETLEDLSHFTAGQRVLLDGVVFDSIA